MLLGDLLGRLRIGGEMREGSESERSNSAYIRPRRAIVTVGLDNQFGSISSSWRSVDLKSSSWILGLALILPSPGGHMRFMMSLIQSVPAKATRPDSKGFGEYTGQMGLICESTL